MKTLLITGGAAALVLSLSACSGANTPLQTPEPERTWWAADASGGGSFSLPDVYRDRGTGPILVCAHEGDTVVITDTGGFTPRESDLSRDEVYVDGDTISVVIGETSTDVAFWPAGKNSPGDWVMFEIGSGKCP